MKAYRWDDKQSFIDDQKTIDEQRKLNTFGNSTPPCRCMAPRVAWCTHPNCWCRRIEV